MSMTDPQHTNPVWTGRLVQWRTSILTGCRDAGAWCVALIKGPSNTLPLVPSENIAGRALVTVIAIMTFLAALTAVSAQMIASAATDWQTSVATEMTIQVRPVPGRNIDQDVSRIVSLASSFKGIREVNPSAPSSTR